MEVGNRTLVTAFDYSASHRATETWVLRPRDNLDLEKGFEAITYAEAANAVNHAAAWLRSVLPTTEAKFDTFAYQGENDLRCPLLLLAASKISKQIVFPSRGAHPDAQAHIIRAAKASAYLRAASSKPMFSQDALDVPTVIVPELNEWLTATPAAPVPYEKSYEDAKDDPCVMFHTSGTTGLPKVVAYSQGMMTATDAAAMLKDTQGDTGVAYYGVGQWYTSIPQFHLLGLVTTLQMTLFLGIVAIIGPIGNPFLPADKLMNLIDHAKPTGLLVTPWDVEKLAASSEGWTRLKRLQCISYGGAQLRKTLGDELMRAGVRVIAGMGCTEAGGYHHGLRDDMEWEWLSFLPCLGARFDTYHADEDMYELVIERRPEFARYQQVFRVYPDLKEFRTQDLFWKHPSKKGLYRFAGRTNDFFKLAHGHGVFAATLEEAITQHAGDVLSGVLLDGTGRDRPFVLAMPTPQALIDAGNAQAMTEKLWPAVQKANEKSGELGRVPKELILVADPQRPFKKTGKGNVSRAQTLAAYKEDIDRLYGTIPT